MKAKCIVPVYFYEVFKCMHCAKMSIMGGFNVKFRVVERKILLQRQMYLAVKSIIWPNVI